MKKYWLGITLTLAIIIIGLTFGIRSTLELIDILSNDTKIELNRLEGEISEQNDYIQNLTIVVYELEEQTHYLHERFEYVQRNYSKLTHEEINLLIEGIVELSKEE